MAQRYHINEYVIGTEMKALSPAKQWKSFLAKSAKVFRGADQLRAEPVRLLPPAHRPSAATLTGVDMYEPLKTARVGFAQQGGGGLRQVLRRGARVDPAQDRDPGDGHRGPGGRLPGPPNLTLTGKLDQTIQYNWFTAGCAAVKRFHLRAIFFWKVDLADNPVTHPAPSLSTWEGRWERRR